MVFYSYDVDIFQSVWFFVYKNKLLIYFVCDLISCLLNLLFFFRIIYVWFICLFGFYSFYLSLSPSFDRICEAISIAVILLFSFFIKILKRATKYVNFWNYLNLFWNSLWYKLFPFYCENKHLILLYTYTNKQWICTLKKLPEKSGICRGIKFISTQAHELATCNNAS